MFVYKGASTSVLKFIASKFGIPYSSAEWSFPSLLRNQNYGSLITREQRQAAISSARIFMEGYKNIANKKVSLIDDVFNTGGLFGILKRFLEENYNVEAPRGYVLLSLKNTGGLPLEDTINAFLIKEKGVQGLIDMVNHEDVIITKHVVKMITPDLYPLLLEPKRNAVIAKQQEEDLRRLKSETRDSVQLSSGRALINAVIRTISRSIRSMGGGGYCATTREYRLA